MRRQGLSFWFVFQPTSASKGSRPSFLWVKSPCAQCVGNVHALTTGHFGGPGSTRSPVWWSSPSRCVCLLILSVFSRLTGWGHCGVGLVNRRTESCPLITQPQDSCGSSSRTPWFPRGHLAIPRAHSHYNLQRNKDLLISSEWGPEVLRIHTQDRPRGQLLSSPQVPTVPKTGDCI